jgi:hypothetical protein
MNPCKNCQKLTKNPKYCSISCSAKVNNKVIPKRQIEEQNKCLSCKKRLSRRKGSRKYQLCKNCLSEKNILNFGDKTKIEITNLSLSYSSKHRYEKIRQHAKRISSKMNWFKTKCEKCSYDKHVELCHVKPIHSFSDDSLVKEINDKNNICFLCPNCHWELDNLT